MYVMYVLMYLSQIRSKNIQIVLMMCIYVCDVCFNAFKNCFNDVHFLINYQLCVWFRYLFVLMSLSQIRSENKK